MENIRISDLAHFFKGKNYKQVPGGAVPVYNIGGRCDSTDTSICDKPCIAIGAAGTIGRPRLFNPPYWITGTQIYIVPKERVDLFFFLFAVIDDMDFTVFQNKFAMRDNLDEFKFKNYEVPLLPLQEQQRIGATYMRICHEIEREQQALTIAKHFKNVMLTGMFVDTSEDQPKCYDLKG